MTNRIDSIDHTPWKHPYITPENISKFRSYSDDVWKFALEHYQKNPEPLDCAFTFNMAQNMYNWSRLAQSYGTKSTLYLHEMDKFPFSQPEWEDYDGELSELTDYKKFQTLTGHIVPEVETATVPINSEEFRFASSAFSGRNQSGGNGRSLLMLLRQNPKIRYEVFEAYPSLMAYYDWAKALTRHDVVYAACNPFPAYASGVPYMAMTVGGDFEIDCGRGDYYGRALSFSFNNARFVTISNPHVLAHSRRLGFTNGIYLPYPMDTDRYSPGEGKVRKEWVGRYGDGIYVLSTSRIDSKVKGQTNEFIEMLFGLAGAFPTLRFIFLGWGANLQSLNEKIHEAGLGQRIIILPPAGKKRLIDYYRSCDMVLDQFVYGYYGATALEAASIGKPVIMKVREDQYSPLYNGDLASFCSANSIDEIKYQITNLVESADKRVECGRNNREWIVRNHSDAKTIPILQSLLRLTASNVSLPSEIVNPLTAPLSEDEVAYHSKCLILQ